MEAESVRIPEILVRPTLGTSVGGAAAVGEAFRVVELIDLRAHLVYGTEYTTCQTIVFLCDGYWTAGSRSRSTQP